MKVTLGSTRTLELQSSLKTCPKCGGKKELIIDMAGEKRKVPCLCKCEAEERDKLKELDERKQKILRLEKLRSHSLMGKQFESCTFQNLILDYL